MSKRLPIIVCALALVTAACGSIPDGEIVAGEGARFVPFVAEFLDDAGLGNSVAVDAEGVPYASYWIFPAELKEGEIPVGRPLGSPYIVTDDQEPKEGAAVGVASLSAEGVWTRGAAAQVRETPSGVYIPYGPAFERSLIGDTAENTNGTDIAIDGSGAKHVVWTGQNGVFYAGGTDAFAVERVYSAGFDLRKAGPVGRPSVTTDDSGAPWVAYTVNAADQEVRVATKSGDAWQTQTVATVQQCAGCPQPLPARIGVTSGGPMVAWVDTEAGSVMASTLDGNEWVATEVGAGGGQGLDMAVDADGNALLSFYDGDGGVQLARQTGASWSLTTIADAQPADLEALGNFAPTTGIAVDSDGALVAAWDDADGVKFATSEDGESFTPVDTLDTIGGRSPSVGVSADGSNIFLAWYDVEGQNLRFGVQGDVADLAVAAPSPTVAPDQVPAPAPDGGGGGDCGADGEIRLDIVAKGIAWDTTCLVGPAGEAFTVNVDNQDAGIPHNFDLLTEEGGDQIGATAVEPGIVQQTLDIDPLDVGEYHYVCDVHPNMTGTLVTVEVKGG
ncbi:MAG: cupredoxin domain-containing protein [Actinomycetota bacterium]|nr:cupredoxin domain-containing protein [Actinomycetota bacterium]